MLRELTWLHIFWALYIDENNTKRNKCDHKRRESPEGYFIDICEQEQKIYPDNPNC